jgi:pimeloyl-ACP methyl ester carboxylesterase
VAAVRQVLRDRDEPTVVVAHSYGGMVTAEAAEGIDTVRHILLIASFLPEVGESLSSFGDGSPAPYLDVDLESGVFRARPEMLADTFLQDCSPELAGEALEHLADQSLSVTQQPVAAAAWQSVPTTYLVCARDRGTPLAAQRELARRANTVIEVDSGHHPFISRPELVAELIATLA